MFWIYDANNDVFAQCEPGFRQTSNHIGDNAAELLDNVVGQGYAVEFQGQVHHPEGVDWHDLSLLRAEFCESETH